MSQTIADDETIKRDEMQYRAATFIETYTGRAFWPLKPTPDALSVIDIAHALSNQCRYSGHVQFFYSVAQHCCVLALYMQEQGHSPLDCLRMLMHDAAEAYLVDIPRPVKQYMQQYRVWDHAIGDVIDEWMGFTKFPKPAVIDDLDNRIIVDERAALMSKSGNDWGHHHDPVGIEIVPWTPAVAERTFLRLYAEYSKTVYGSHQYVNYDWGINAEVSYFPTVSDMQRPPVLDVIEVDVRGNVARVRLHDEEGRLLTNTNSSFPSAAWGWKHGKFEILERAA